MTDLPITEPLCIHCDRPARRTDGREVYPHRRDLHDRVFYRCDDCDAHVGAHRSSGEPLGRPANAELRRARMTLHHDVLDPLWLNAPATGGYEPEDLKARGRIQGSARGRVYAWLADRMGLTREQTHTALFDLDQCRRAYRLLKGVTYPEIRQWAKARKKQEA